jgi:hypothetical protein
MTTAQTPADRRQRRLLVGLALLFLAPVGLSFYLYYGHSHLTPGGRVNRGQLVEPPRTMPAAALPLLEGGATAPDLLARKWTLLYAAPPGPCADRCRHKLYETRQVRTALDRDMSRVQRVFIAADGCCDLDFLHREHPDLITVRADGAAAIIAALPDGGGGAPIDAGRLYIVDPLGNLMMSYPADAAPKGLLEDMKRLLKLSHIG